VSKLAVNYKPGAIVLTIYFILLKNNRINNWFTPKFIYDEYKKLKVDPKTKKCIEAIKIEYKKHGTLDTLNDLARIRGWLKKHVNNKPIFWFEHRISKSNQDEFKFKDDLIIKLQRELNTLPPCI
jgi:hypothetical protein